MSEHSPSTTDCGIQAATNIGAISVRVFVIVAIVRDVAVDNRSRVIWIAVIIAATAWSNCDSVAPAALPAA